MTDTLFVSFFAIAIFQLSILGPASLLCQKIGRGGVEAFSRGVGVSLFCVFFLSWVIFLWSLPGALFCLAPVFGVVCVALSLNGVKTMLRSRNGRNIALSYLLLHGFFLAMLASVGAYHGGDWGFDWYEHFARAQYFAGMLSLDELAAHDIMLPGRPPLANVVYAGFFRILSGEFFVFQTLCVSMSLLCFFPMLLFTRRIAGERGTFGAPFVLSAFLMLSPVFVHETLYPWTKSPTAFFILLGLFCFLRSRMEWAFFFLGGALLTHYSAGVYIATTAPLLVWRLLGERGHRREAMKAAALRTARCLGALCLTAAPWFGWALLRFGAGGALLSNTAVQDAGRYSLAQNVSKVAANLRGAVLPHFARSPESGYATNLSWENVGDILATMLRGGEYLLSHVIALRDAFFLVYQTNIIFGVGAVGALVLAIYWGRAWRTVDKTWLVWAGGVVGLGVAVHGEYAYFGVAQICLAPLLFWGIACLAGVFLRSSLRMRWLLVIGCVLDGIFGVFLHLVLLHISPRFLLGMSSNYTGVRDFSEYATALASMVGPHAGANMLLQMRENIWLLGECLGAPLTSAYAAAGAVLLATVLLALRHVSHPGDIQEKTNCQDRSHSD